MAARGNRRIRRGHGRALDGKARGAALIEQNGTVRTAGSGLGQGVNESASGSGGARAEVQAPTAGIGTTGSGGASKPGHHVRKQRVRKGGKWPTSPNLPSAAFPDFQGGAGVKLLIDNLSAETKLRLCAMDLLRERKTVNVSR